MDNYEEETSDSGGEFAFETDHLALRGNKDYSELLKYIVKLEAQKVQALKDIEGLNESKIKALDDPISFVQSLKSGNLKFPPRQVISDIPRIDWEKYGIDISLESEKSKRAKDEMESGMKVRGRTFTDNKPETFNQLWSCEEQKRLEELLEIYPEEPIEARRYKKIAEALGTRTPLQVMSRIQKYFAKLAKAGLPVPGRAPKYVGKDKHKSMLYKKSTFFPKLHVPVKMEDPNDDSEGPDTVSLETRTGNSLMLDLLKAAKVQRLLDETAPVYQTKTMCVGCQKVGFLGARWTDNAGTDYCTDCLVKLLPAEKLTPIRHPI
ncbi:ZZ-type zinc finger-containing protein 3 [Zerene cesonia]|uniref:ZZ-type zinc finger-containing protein 3 n=1 Tax=Zerene cesonia TaxID=33412 RepID=UPI0018E54906|nr:ZZ-type zinc finger-containing protein 3 [Zerene cesonia]